MNYAQVNKALSRRALVTKINNEIKEDTLLLASGGVNKDFYVIYTRLKSEQLSREQEKNIVDCLLQEHPYSLFVFSNKAQSQ